MRATIATLAVLAALPAFANQINRTIPAGGVLKDLHYGDLNPDCTSKGYPTVRVTSGPSNGSISMTKGVFYPFYPPENSRNVCNSRRSPGTILSYRPQPGFVGSDSFTVDVFFPSGTERNDVYYINVK